MPAARTIHHRLRFVAAVVLGAIAIAPAVATAAAPAALVGTFAIVEGSCDGGVSGSYLRLVLPSGSVDNGPYVDNQDSACGDGTYTLLAPGRDGGLRTGTYQPAPDPAFDDDGNSLADRINLPVAFFGVDFSASTNAEDLQTGEATAVPAITHDAGQLQGDLSAFAATWNGQSFNQGAPKPDGSMPGNTSAVTGTYDPATGEFAMTWASHIVGGPFNNFTGVWHLEGVFRPDAATTTATSAPATTTTTGATTTSTTVSEPDATTTTTGSVSPTEDDATTDSVATTVAAAGATTSTTEGTSTETASEDGDQVASGAEGDDDGPGAAAVLVAIVAVGAAGFLLWSVTRRTRAS